MAEKTIIAKPLTKSGFYKFGEILETDNRKSYKINNGMCQRFNKLSSVNVDLEKGMPALSIFRSKPYSLPLHLKLLERHPFGSQAFMPLHSDPFLVIVADDFGGQPTKPKAFFTNGHQGINIYRNIWHGVLTPVRHECDFLVVDLPDCEENLEKFIPSEKTIITANM